MGLSSFPCPSDGGVLPLLVMNTVMSVAFVASKLRSVLRVPADRDSESKSRARAVSITRYGSLCGAAAAECCVCLCGFEADEEVSELCCKHVFHRGCLDKWFDSQRITCPLCRSIVN